MEFLSLIQFSSEALFIRHMVDTREKNGAKESPTSEMYRLVKSDMEEN